MAVSHGCSVGWGMHEVGPKGMSAMRWPGQEHAWHEWRLMQAILVLKQIPCEKLPA